MSVDKLPGVLIVEDEVLIALAMRVALGAAGFGVIAAATGEEGAALAAERRPGIVFMDLSLGGRMDGFEAYERIREAYRPRFVFMTGYADEATKRRVEGLEDAELMHKPAEAPMVVELARRIAAELASRGADARR